jgi:hypothetical protein
MVSTVKVEGTVITRRFSHFAWTYWNLKSDTSDVLITGYACSETDPLPGFVSILQQMWYTVHSDVASKYSELYRTSTEDWEAPSVKCDRLD